MGTGGIVTAGLSTYRPVTGNIGEEEQPTPTQLTRRMMTILPALAPLEGCSVLGRPPLLSAVGGENFVATIQCTGSSPGVRIQTSGATLTIPVPPGPSTGREPDVSSLRAAGPMAYFLTNPAYAGTFALDLNRPGVCWTSDPLAGRAAWQEPSHHNP
jgi:hypothetical protein